MLPVTSFAPAMEVVGHVVGGVGGVVTGGAGKVKKSHGEPVIVRGVSGSQFKTGKVTPWLCPAVGTATRPQSSARCEKITNTRRELLRMNAPPLCEIPIRP